MRPASSNAPILANYTNCFSRYVILGNTYIDSANKTREYLINKGAFESSTVFKNILFGSINDYLTDAAESYSLYFRLKLNILSTNYGFSVICIDDNAKLINFTDTYDKFSAAELTAMPVSIAEYADEELYEMAINEDQIDLSIDEQYIEKYFDV